MKEGVRMGGRWGMKEGMRKEVRVEYEGRNEEGRKRRKYSIEHKSYE